jgi:hypothetical protein
MEKKIPKNNTDEFFGTRGSGGIEGWRTIPRRPSALFQQILAFPLSFSFLPSLPSIPLSLFLPCRSPLRVTLEATDGREEWRRLRKQSKQSLQALLSKET